MIHWRLTGLQYEALFYAARRDRLPYPTGDTIVADSETELAAQREDALETLLPRVDDDMAKLVHILTEPRVRVQVHGYCEDGAAVRGYAAFGPTVAGVAVRHEDDGDVTVSLCSHRQAPPLVVRTIPPQRPGQQRLIVMKADLDLPPLDDGSSNTLTARDRVERFFARRRSGWGEVLCSAGPFVDNRAEDMQGFRWLDFTGDGRYYVREDKSAYTATPMDDQRLIAYIEGLVERARHDLLDKGAHTRAIGRHTLRSAETIDELLESEKGEW